MKKLLLVLTVVFVVVAGCTSQPAPTATPAPPSSIPPSTSTAAAVPPTSTPAPGFVAPTPSHVVEVTKDVEYAKLLEADAPAQKLDVYAPAEPGPWPVVVVIHTSFQTKDSLRYTSLAKELAGRGVVVFVPQSRSLAATVIEAAQENGREYRELDESWACAVRFARESAAEYGGDPGRVTMFSDLGRGSAAAFMGDDLQPQWEQVASSRGGPPPQAECLSGGDTAHVDALVDFSADYEAYEVLEDSEPDLWALTSPYALIGRNPSLVVHLLFGEQLGPEQFERTEEYYKALQSAGYDATLTNLPDTRFEIPWSGPDRETLIQAILEAARR
jgi:acetyl esterase/lipase